MKRRRSDVGRVPFPVELLDEDLPSTDPRVVAAREAAGWGVVTYLRAKVRRRRELLGWGGGVPPAFPGDVSEANWTGGN